MADVAQHEHGMLSWADLGTTDLPSARRFYSELFGWSYQERQGPEGLYLVAQLRGRTASAIYDKSAELREKGLPPHWMSYFAVANVDERASRIETLGGKLVAGPLDAGPKGAAGRMVAALDPAGAVFALWQGRANPGAGVTGEPGALCWTELSTPKPAAVAGFYKGVLDWTEQIMPMPDIGDYTVFNAGGKPSCGMMQTPQGSDGPPAWLPYFAVAGADDTFRRALDLGGRDCVQPQDIPGVGRFAVLADAQGVPFGVLQPAPR
jgi:predicted enzyme related to lactoylglutathione lyase